ncbi:hypothetical protein GCM10022197_20660 [Microlunatus spumicola]|uniref:Uncharacterized protein n=1 Tax=Microlunatus spumicola TaxID=81499 RepID=A0ABP6XC28_9ACTN
MVDAPGDGKRVTARAVTLRDPGPEVALVTAEPLPDPRARVRSPQAGAPGCCCGPPTDNGASIHPGDLAVKRF